MDRAHVLHPYTGVTSFAQTGSQIITRAEGMYVTDTDGRQLLDGIGGLWCVNIGHGRAEMADAVARQTQDHCPDQRLSRRHGKPFEVALVEEPDLMTPANDKTCLSYVNACIANGGLVIPSFNTPTDTPGRSVFARAFPDRQIAQVDIRDICWNGGGIHCITQQQPA